MEECKEKLCTVGQILIEQASALGTHLEQFATTEFVLEPGCTCKKHDTAKTQTVVRDDQESYAHAEVPPSADGMLYSAFVPPAAVTPTPVAFGPPTADRSAKPDSSPPEQDNAATAVPVELPVLAAFNSLWAEPEAILPRPPTTIQSSAIVSTAVREAPWAKFMPDKPNAARPQANARAPIGSSPSDQASTVGLPPGARQAPPAPQQGHSPNAYPAAAAPMVASPRAALLSIGEEEEFSKFELSNQFEVHDEDNISHVSELVVPKITPASTPAAKAEITKPPAVKSPAPVEAAPADKVALAPENRIAPTRKASRSADDAKSAIVPPTQSKQGGSLKMGSKSVLSQSMAMQSSAAASLGALIQAGGGKAAAGAAAEKPSAGESQAVKEVEKSAERSKTPPAASREKDKKPDDASVLGSKASTSAKTSTPSKPRDKSSDAKSTLSVNTNLNSSAANVLGPLAAAGARGRGKSSDRRSGDLKSTLSMNAPSNSAAATALSSVTAGGGGSAKRESSSGEKRTKDETAATKRDDSSSVKDAKSVVSTAKSTAGNTRPKVDSKSVISGLNTSSSAASALLGPMMAQQGKPKKRADRQGGESKSVIA